MTIHKGNIEAYLLDYLEGTLDALLTAELMAFLSENPEYEKWIPEYDGHVCLETGPAFEGKSILKKNFRDVPLVCEQNFEEFCIASFEGLLDDKDRERLDEYIVAHPEKQYDFDVYGKLYLKPDYLISFPRKKENKKRQPLAVPARFIYYAIGAAASVTLVLLLVSRKPAEPVFTQATTHTSTSPLEKNVPAAAVPIPVESAKSPAPVSAGNRTNRHSLPPDEPQPSLADNSIQPMATIDPIGVSRISSRGARPEIERKIVQTERPLNYPEEGETISASVETPAKLIGTFAKKLNLWKAAETAVTGLNYLTETRLSLVKTTDENGKFSGLSLESEEYIPSGNNVK